MKNLKFKRTGKFLDEMSTRYEAQFSDNVFVRIYKCAYSKAWKICYMDFLGMELGSLNGNLDPQYSKKECIEMIEWMRSDKEQVARLEEMSRKEGRSHNEWLKENGKETRKRYKI